MTAVNWTYCGAHFTIYADIKLDCYIPKTNMLIISQFFKIVNFISVLPQEKKKAQMSGRIEIIIKQTKYQEKE